MMTEEDLNEFIKYNEESETLEYKLKPNFNEIDKSIKKIQKRMHFNILKTIYAFANTEGGELYIGVDEDRGADIPYKAEGMNSCDKKIVEQTILKPLQSSIIKTEKEDIQLENGRVVIKINVDKLQLYEKPIFLDGILYVRKGKSTEKVSSFNDYLQLYKDKQLYMCYEKGIKSNLKKLAEQDKNFEIKQFIEGLKIHIKSFIENNQITGYEQALNKVESLLRDIEQKLNNQASNIVDSQDKLPSLDSLIEDFIKTYKAIISKG